MPIEPIENEKNKYMRNLHHNMAIVGGFMAAYAILLRADFLGNSQTANLIYLVFAILGRNITDVLLRLIALLLYIGGVFTFVFIKNKTSWNVHRIAILIDLIAIFILGCIPADANAVAALYPIFFAMAFQWCAIPGSYGYASASIFSTNNTKQFALSFAEYLCDGEKKHLHKAKFFFGSLLCFHIGVIISYFATKAYSTHAIYFNAIPVIVALVWVRKLEKIK